MFHPLWLRGFINRLSRLRSQTMRDLGLLLIHRPSQAFL